MLYKNFNHTNFKTNLAMNSLPSDWDSLLQLLGLIIVADKKTLKVEVDTFLDAVEELRDVIDPTISLTRNMARDWFILNKEKLEDIIDGLDYDMAICEALAPIESIPHKREVILKMLSIAISDNDFADVEKGLIKKTILYWNIPVLH